MYLSKLELFGFKSFAQRVHVRFDSGLTAVVGPNGCGKTNIVDAIRWVLGEQKTSVLRSDKMENVIFNGTKNRKPLGMSEVSITIENTKNILPTEYTEVTLTRRLYRSGDSEYLLNKVPCRLKDIVDLFVDTGMGTDAYSVIELKMIEQILSENADERRRLFEEAAGITKYKQRRKQTFKKLETTAQDLARVKDIVAEVEKKVGTLERQAEKAEKARKLKDELRTNDLALAERQYAGLMKKVEPLEQSITERSDELQHLTAQIDTLDAALQALQLETLETERRLSAGQKEIQQKTELVTGVEKQTLSSDERKKSLSENVGRYAAEWTNAAQRQAELEAMSLSLQSELSSLDEEYSGKKRAADVAKETVTVKEMDLRDKRKALDEKRGDALRVSERLNALSSRSEKLNTSLSGIEAQAQRATERDVKLHELIAAKKKEAEIFNTELTQIASELEAASLALETAKVTRAALQASIEKRKESALTLRSEIGAKSNRIEFLQSLLESYEGLPEGIAYLDKQTGKPHGLGSLSDLISTDERYKLAIDAALGEALSYYVSRTTAEAMHGIAALREADKGKVTFIILERIERMKNALAGVALVPDATTRAASVITCADEVRPLIELLLANTVIAESLDDAEKLAATHPELLSFVTHSGERYKSSGIIRGGSNKGAESLRIGKQAELETRLAEKSALASQLAEVESALASELKSFTEISLVDAEQNVKQLEQRITASEKAIAKSEVEKSSFEEEASRVADELSESAVRIAGLREELQPIAPQLELEQALLAEFNRLFEADRAAIAALDAEVREDAEEAQDKMLSLQQAEFELDKIRTRIETAAQSIESLERQQSRITSDRDAAEREIFRLTAELETMKENLVRYHSERDTMQQAIAEVEAQYVSQKSETNQSESRLRDLRRQRDVVSQLVLEFRQQLSGAKLKAENIFAVAKSEYEIELSVKEFFDEAPFDAEATSKEVQRLKDRIKNLGLVNELALEEYDAEKQRLDFLNAQQTDLLDAEKQLRDTIEQINLTAQDQFMQTFTAIRQNFIRIFKELFLEGDEADLYLQESEDPLEANIEIMAKPRGKRPQSIMLLSGGEKTLTAIALLFAIYLVKPSPFCILDEVDAPLDDANIDRFIRIIQKFSVETQFIMVTHNKRTMEAARALYGVTMEEEGISKLVAVRWNDAPTETASVS